VSNLSATDPTNSIVDTEVSSSASASNHARDISPRSVIVDDADALLFEPTSPEHSSLPKKQRDDSALSPATTSSNKRLKESLPSSSSLSRNYAADADADTAAVENVGRCTKVEKATSSKTATTTGKE
jgi:hypothetical protein